MYWFLPVVGVVCSDSSSAGKTRVGINGKFLVVRVLLDVSSFFNRLAVLILLHTSNFVPDTYKLRKPTSFAFHIIFYHIPVSFRM